MCVCVHSDLRLRHPASDDRVAHCVSLTPSVQCIISSVSKRLERGWKGREGARRQTLTRERESERTMSDANDTKGKHMDERASLTHTLSDAFPALLSLLPSLCVSLRLGDKGSLRLESCSHTATSETETQALKAIGWKKTKGIRSACE